MAGNQLIGLRHAVDLTKFVDRIARIHIIGHVFVGDRPECVAGADLDGFISCHSAAADLCGRTNQQIAATLMMMLNATNSVKRILERTMYFIVITPSNRQSFKKNVCSYTHNKRMFAFCQ